MRYDPNKSYDPNKGVRVFNVETTNGKIHAIMVDDGVTMPDEQLIDMANKLGKDAYDGAMRDPARGMMDIKAMTPDGMHMIHTVHYTLFTLSDAFADRCWGARGKGDRDMLRFLNKRNGTDN